MASVPQGQLALNKQPGRAFCYAPVLEEADSNLFWDVQPGETGGKTDRLVVWTMGEKLPEESRIVVSRDKNSHGFNLEVEKPVVPADLEWFVNNSEY